MLYLKLLYINYISFSIDNNENTSVLGNQSVYSYFNTINVYWNNNGYTK